MQSADFDPASASGQIAIACNYYERSIILPRTLAEIRRRAPRLLLEIKTARAKGIAQTRRSRSSYWPL
ncbi:hypothetical protein AC629_26555 [Bradyrhizobium sp. NAS80.1]|nr:hypothetical protein AC629_26555 [Bradyrhizobium sp. NAS80.1]